MASDMDSVAVSTNNAGLMHPPQSSALVNSSASKEEKKKTDNRGKQRKNYRGVQMTFTRFKKESKLDNESLSYITEDTRMSTLQRKLIRESNPVISLGLALQISEVILYHENRGYIFRSSEVICDAIKEVLLGNKSSSSSSNINHGEAVKTESAKAIGRVAYVLSDGINSGKLTTLAIYIVL